MRMVDDHEIGESLVKHNQTSFWKTIWHLNIPPKIRIFTWRVCRNSLPTMLNLRSRVLTSLVFARYVTRIWSPPNMPCSFVLTPNLHGFIGQTAQQTYHLQMQTSWTLLQSSSTLARQRSWPYSSRSYGQFGGIETKPFMRTLQSRQP